MKITMKYTFLFVVVCLILSALQPIVLASDVPVYALSIDVDDYCNCDSDCKSSEDDTTGCMTSRTGPDILTLNRYAADYIDTANDNFYNGVCAVLTFDGNEITTTMTSDCTANFEPEPEVIEEPEEPVIETEDPVEEESTTEINSMNNTTAEQAGINNTNSEQNSSLEEQNDTQTLGMEEDIMVISTAQLFAITFIVIGFFGLMGWMAYLLKN